MPAITKPGTLFILGCAMLSGQTVPAQPRFEVVSIKPVDRLDLPKSVNFRGGSLKATNYSLKNLIQTGWDVRDFQVLGGPAWLDSDRYNVEAKPAVPLDMFEPGSDVERQLRLMVQSFVIERFGLKLHRETRK